MNSTIQQANEVNRLGAYVLRRGELARAHILFQKALVMLNELSESHPQSVSSSNQNPLSEFAALVHEEKFTREVSTEIEVKKLDCIDIEACGLDDERFYIFNKVMVYSAKSESIHEMCITTAVIYFNLAICYHIAGIKMKHNSLLQKSATLYDHCFKLLLPFKSSKEPQILVFAVLNNQAHIYYHFQNGVKTRELLKELSTFLRFRSRNTKYEAKEVLNIWLNTFSFYKSCFAAPSA